MREGRVARVGESGACDVSGGFYSIRGFGGHTRVRARVTVVWAVPGR
jgi:hypothetical protein